MKSQTKSAVSKHRSGKHKATAASAKRSIKKITRTIKPTTRKPKKGRF